MRILICGIGIIGTHIYEEFKDRNEIYLYDKYKPEYNSDPTMHYDAAFICVPTEAMWGGMVDTREVEEVVHMLNADVIILKSTVPVGTSRQFKLNNLVMSPETYGATQHSAEMPDFVILGGLPSATSKAAQVYQTVKNGSFRFQFVNWETAELSKYMMNCWLATKVTFCNEFADIASSFGVEYSQLRECFIMDPRINPSHTFVYPDKPYYDSHCFNKDIPGLLSQTDKAPLIKEVNIINNNKKTRTK